MTFHPLDRDAILVLHLGLTDGRAPRLQVVELLGQTLAHHMVYRESQRLTDALDPTLAKIAEDLAGSVDLPWDKAAKTACVQALLPLGLRPLDRLVGNADGAVGARVLVLQLAGRADTLRRFIVADPEARVAIAPNGDTPHLTKTELSSTRYVPRMDAITPVPGPDVPLDLDHSSMASIERHAAELELFATMLRHYVASNAPDQEGSDAALARPFDIAEPRQSRYRVGAARPGRPGRTA